MTVAGFKTVSTITMDFNKAKSQADKLDEIAAKIKKAGNSDLKSCMNEVQSAWTGDNSNAYRKKGNAVAEDLVEVSKNISAVASALRKVAKTTYDAEMDNYRIATERTKK